MSVVIPSYNSASILPDAIESVLAQTLPPTEVIVVDDGSADDTRGVCGRYPRVRCLRRANGGASAARNTGLAAAASEWVAFLDADDRWEPDKLETQFAALGQNPAADFAISAVNVWSPGRQSYHRMSWNGSLDPMAMVRELLVRNIFTGLCSTLLIRRRTLLELGGFDSGRACEDRRLAIRLLLGLPENGALAMTHVSPTQGREGVPGRSSADAEVGRGLRGVLIDKPLVRQRPGPAHWTDPERHRGEMIRFIEDHDRIYAHLDPTGRVKRRAVARMHERSGMHYLENGDRKRAARDLVRAARLRPTLANPWRVLANYLLGRLPPAPTT